MKRALVFDFDGLIVDSETPEYECWRAVYQAHGLDLDVRDWVRVVGGAVVVDMRQELQRRIPRPFSPGDWERLEAKRLAHHQRLWSGQPLLPGVQALFDEARRRGWGIGVASNSSVAWVRSGLQRYGLWEHVQAIRGRDTAARPKPLPDSYLEVLAELGAEAGASFGLEDSAPGVAAARAAGLTVVAVPNGLTKHQDLSAAHVILESLEQFRLPE